MTFNLTEKQIVRFYSKIRFQPNGCWQWIGRDVACEGAGSYGPHLQPRFSLGDQKVYARRLSYFITFNKLPNVLRPSCGNELCVNPMHLQHCIDPFRLTGKVFTTKKKKRIPLKTINSIILMRKRGAKINDIINKFNHPALQISTILRMARLCREDKLKVRSKPLPLRVA